MIQVSYLTETVQRQLIKCQNRKLLLANARFEWGMKRLFETLKWIILEKVKTIKSENLTGNHGYCIHTEGECIHNPECGKTVHSMSPELSGPLLATSNNIIVFSMISSVFHTVVEEL